MTQIISQNNGGGSGGGTPYTAGNGIDISAQNEISVDTNVVQTVGNMVDNLTGADNDHYPTAKAVADAISGGGLGDVIGPASSTDGNVVLFDGVTGKIIKDSGANLSSKLDASALSNNNYGGAWQGDSTHTPTKGVLYDKIHTMDVEIGNKAADNTVVKLTGNQTINGTKTFGTSPVVPSKTADATNTGTAIATEAQVYTVADAVSTINGKISSNASSSNKLMDKNYIDDAINSISAYYITKNANGDQFATYAELAAATTFYSGGVQRTPTRNDYTIVLADENHDNATTRYIYNASWEYQYTVNETALTQAQLDALNSGITAAKVSTYDGYATGKQDELVSGTNIKTINGTSVLGSGDIVTPNTTYTAGTNINIDANNEISATDTTYTAGTGLALNGTEFSNAGVTSVNSQTGAVNVTEFSPASAGSTDQVLTKTADGYDWATPSSSGIVCDPNSPITIDKIRCGTEAQYSALGSYSSSTAYLTV